MGPRLAVHKAAYAVLTADNGAGGLFDPAGHLVAGVWDNVPEGSVPPYVQLGEFAETPWNTSTSRGAQVLATIRVYTEDTTGFAQGAAVLDRLDALLDDFLGDTTALAAALAADGWHMVMAQKVTSDSQRQDAITPADQLPAQYRITVQQPRP